MLDDKGNTAVYLLYAYTRIKSIARRGGITIDQLKEHSKSNPLNLPHEKEQKLMKVIQIKLIRLV
jgi:arginyl-tRNA synthetase